MLEKIFKTHFWVFTIFFLLSSSYLLAKTASSAVLAFLPAPIPSRPFVVKTSANNQNIPTRLTGRFIFRGDMPNAFDKNNSTFTPTKPQVKDDGKKPDKAKSKKKLIHCDPMGTYQPTKLPLQLKGTVVASDPSYSVAAVYDAKRRKMFVLKVGENFSGIKICKVEPKYLKIDRGVGRLEYLELGAKPGRMRGNFNRSLYKHYRKLRKTNFNTKDIKKLGNSRYQIPRNFIKNVTQRLDILASQAAIVPYFEKGRSAGFRIYNIRKNSLYKKIGVRNGDVIKRINGYEFTSPQKALEAYSNLASSDNLSVELVRKGKRMNMSYEIKGK